MLARAYLAAAMLRRILACLALITGLAAIGTPAHARMNAVVAQQVEDCAPGLPGRPAAVCNSGGTAAEEAARTVLPVKSRPRRPVLIYIPTVQYGPDRAWE